MQEKKRLIVTMKLPAGVIVYYSGDLSKPENIKALRESGWLLCDGQPYDKNKYHDLFVAIGTANGGAGNNFNVPDLRNRFIRGTLGDGKDTDPDAGTRVKAAAGGATGNHTGSLQLTATSLPTTPWVLLPNGSHTHTGSHLSLGKYLAYDGENISLTRDIKTIPTQNAGAHDHTLTDFDPSTRPVSLALYFIIKYGEPTAPTGVIPAGAITGFGGAVSAAPANWLKCNGAECVYSVFRILSETISTNYGGEGSAFRVPDLRGYFLRGTAHGAVLDPDRSARLELQPGGNTGDRIGSVQYDSTANPAFCTASIVGKHTHPIANIPVSSTQVAVGALDGKECLLWTDTSQTSTCDGNHSHVIIEGGDKETRPENIYVDFLIADDNLPQSAPPVGAIMNFGGDITDNNIRELLKEAGWLPCDGSSIRIKHYKELSDIIGTTYGKGPTDLSPQDTTGDFFSLPDLSGLFVIGAGTLSAGTRLLDSKTGAPNLPFKVSTADNHHHDIDGVPTAKHVSCEISGTKFAEYNAKAGETSADGAHTHTVSGADQETRPVNVYVDFIIRCK